MFLKLSSTLDGQATGNVGPGALWVRKACGIGKRQDNCSPHPYLCLPELWDEIEISQELHHFHSPMCQTRTPITAWFECWVRWLWSTAAAPSTQLAEAPQPMSLSPRGVMACAPLFYSLSSDLIIISFMAFCELLKALGEEIKGCILSGLCGYMSPDELFSPVHAHKWLQFTLHRVVKKDEKKKSWNTI